MFFDINKALCDTYRGLDPLKLLDYPAEDVLNLINGLIDYNEREDRKEKKTKNKDGEVMRIPAGDDWF